MQSKEEHLETLSDIRKMMSRSSRFLSLSGLSGVSAGVIALIGAARAKLILDGYYEGYETGGYRNDRFSFLKTELFQLGMIVLALALLSGFYFTWQKTRKQKEKLWDTGSRKLAGSFLIPFTAGAIFILGMLWHSDWRFVAPACLIFYGLALVNASKYTFDDIRYLGYCEVILGLVNVWIPGKGLYFWAAGFGVLHILYGIIMWRKYDARSGS